MFQLIAANAQRLIKGATTGASEMRAFASYRGSHSTKGYISTIGNMI